MIPWQKELVKLRGVEERLWSLSKSEENQTVKDGITDVWNTAYHAYHDRLKEVADTLGVDKDCLNNAVGIALGHVDSMEESVRRTFDAVRRTEKDPVDEDSDEDGEVDE